MRIQFQKTRGCFTPISLGHDPIRLLYIELFGFAFEIAFALVIRPTRADASPGAIQAE